MRRASPFILLLALAACADSHKSTRATPSDAVPGAVALSVGDFADTDQNRYRDTTSITAYVYSLQYPIPLAAKGSFEFELQSVRGEVLHRWSFDQRQSAAALRDMAPGPGFVFNLSLVGGDRIEATDGEIVCTFRPVSGTPVHARPTAPIAIGPILRSRNP
jgi:hypothetical protein